MNKLYLFLLAVAPIAMLLSPGCKTTANDPASVAKGFTEAMLKDDFDAAAGYATAESKSTLDMLEAAKRMSGGSNDKESINMLKVEEGKKITYGDAKLEGTDRAIISVMADGKEVLPLILKRVDSTWKVAFDIASIMDGERLNSKPAAPTSAPPADSFITNLGTMNDSIENAYNQAREDLDSTITRSPGER